MKRFKKILCVIDTGAVNKQALERAVVLAESNQAELTVVDVVEHLHTGIRKSVVGPEVAEMQAALVSEHAQALNKLVEPYRTRVGIKTSVIAGVPFLEIIREVLRNGHDLVVKTPSTHSWLHRLFGSNDMHLLRKCPCPVWFIKSEAKKSWNRILAAVDIDDAFPPEELGSRQVLNRQIFEMASSLALADSAELHVVHAWHAIGESALHGAFMHTPEDKIKAYVKKVKLSNVALMASFMEEMAGAEENNIVDYLKPQIHLVKGWVREVIPIHAKKLKVDLIVMGTVGRTGVPGFIMGNTAEEILNSIECSVLAIKPPGFITPVTLEE